LEEALRASAELRFSLNRSSLRARADQPGHRSGTPVRAECRAARH